MQELVRRQLAQSIETLTRVMHDDALHDALVEAARITSDSMKRGGKLLVCGNGGSAADSQHLVAEFVCRLSADRPALRAIALTTDSSIFTAVANDYSFDRIFERQVEALGQKGDVLLAISTSGNSANCVRALEQARRQGLHTLAFSGNNGGAMKSLADLNIIIPSTVTMNIQESHLALEHIFCMMVELCYFGEGFDRRPQHLEE